jgi:hypothetical protein
LTKNPISPEYAIILILSSHSCQSQPFQYSFPLIFDWNRQGMIKRQDFYINKKLKDEKIHFNNGLPDPFHVDIL